MYVLNFNKKHKNNNYKHPSTMYSSGEKNFWRKRWNLTVPTAIAATEQVNLAAIKKYNIHF